MLLQVVTKSWFLWAFWALWGAVIFCAAAYDGALVLPSPGRGLLQHFGFQAIFFSAPILLIGTHYARISLKNSVRHLFERQQMYEGSGSIETQVAALAEPIRSQFRSYYIIIILGVVGSLFSLLRFRQLSDPQAFWGNDVFNARYYLASYIATNAFLFTLWSIVYPIMLVQMVRTLATGLFIVPRSIAGGALRLDLLHPDGHCGLTRLTGINTSLTGIYVIPASVLLLLYLTHERTYFVPQSFALGFLCLFIIHTAAGLASTAYSISIERDRAVRVWNRRIKQAMRKKFLGGTETLVAFTYRDKLLSISLFPYTKSTIFTAGLLGLMFSAALVYFEWLARQGTT